MAAGTSFARASPMHGSMPSTTKPAFMSVLVRCLWQEQVHNHRCVFLLWFVLSFFGSMVILGQLMERAFLLSSGVVLSSYLQIWAIY